MATPTAEETRQAAAAARLAEKGFEAVNAELEKQAENLEFLKKQKLEIEDLTVAKAKLAADAYEANIKINESLKERARIQKELNEPSLLAFQKAALEEKLALEIEEMANQSKKSDLIKDQVMAVRELIKAEKTYGKDGAGRIKKANKDINTIGKATKQFAGRLPVIGPALSDAFGQGDSIKKYGTQLTGLSEGMKEGFGKTVTGKIGKLFTGVSRLTMAVFTFVLTLAKLGLQFDNASKQIGRATGFGNEFANTLHEGHKQTLASGVSMKEYGDAVTSLANNFSGFNPTAEKTNVYLSNTASQLTKLGVSADSSSKLMDHFHRAMGVSQEAAADMTAQLVLMGKQVGITASKMASDFQASAGRLAIYGKNNIKVFKQLAAQAKATGLEMSTLLGISQKFDQFDTAADSAAQLNAVLGTQLSTLELMNATDAERVRMIKEQVQASVGNFDSLDKFTKMYVAQAMGVKDVAEAQRLLNMSQAEASKYAQGQQESADIQAELAERTKELVPLMDKLKIAFMRFVMAFSPIIKAFTWLVGIMATVIDVVGEFAATWGPMIVLVVSFLKIIGAFGAAVAGVATPIGWFVMATLALVAVLNQLWDVFHKTGSLSMAGGLMDKTIGKSMKALGDDAKTAGSDIDGLSGKMDGLHDTAHKGSGNSFDIQAMASLDTTAIAAGFNKIKSAVMELSNIKMDGFLAMHTDGSSSSFVMGSDGLIKSISEGKLIVDVKMPEMKLPEVLVKVFIGDRELKSIIRTEVKALGGAMG